MAIDWNWGIFLQASPFRQYHLSRLDLVRLSGHGRIIIMCLGDRLLRRFTIWYFKNGAQPNPFRNRGLLR